MWTQSRLAPRGYQQFQLGTVERRVFTRCETGTRPGVQIVAVKHQRKRVVGVTGDKIEQRHGVHGKLVAGHSSGSVKRPQFRRRRLTDHSLRNEEQQKVIIERVRAAPLLTRDDALITPSAMAVKLLAHQIQQAQKTIEEFEVTIAEAMQQHPDAHLFTNLRGAGKALAPRLFWAFGSPRDRW